MVDTQLGGEALHRGWHGTQPLIHWTRASQSLQLSIYPELDPKPPAILHVPFQYIYCINMVENVVGRSLAPANTGARWADKLSFIYHSWWKWPMFFPSDIFKHFPGVLEKLSDENGQQITALGTTLDNLSGFLLAGNFSYMRVRWIQSQLPTWKSLVQYRVIHAYEYTSMFYHRVAATRPPVPHP